MKFILLFFLMSSHLAYTSEECKNLFKTSLLSDTDKSLFGRRAKKAARQLRREYRSHLKDVTMFVPSLPISNVEFLSEESPIAGYKLALLSKKKVYLKEMPDGWTESIFVGLQNLNFIGIPVLFRGVVEGAEGVSYMVYKFEEGGIANSLLVQNISESSLIKDEIEEKLLKIKKFFSQYGIYAEGLEFLVTPESNIYVMRYSHMDFLGKPLSKSVSEEMGMEFHHIIKNIRRNWGALSSSFVGGGLSDKPSDLDANGSTENGYGDVGHGYGDVDHEYGDVIHDIPQNSRNFGMFHKPSHRPEQYAADVFASTKPPEPELDSLQELSEDSSDAIRPVEAPQIEVRDIGLTLKSSTIEGQEGEEIKQENRRHFEDSMQTENMAIPVLYPISPEESARQKREFYGDAERTTHTLPPPAEALTSASETDHRPHGNHPPREDFRDTSESLEMLAQTLGLPSKEPKTSARESFDDQEQTQDVHDTSESLEILAQTLGLPLREPEAPAQEESLPPLAVGEERLESFADTPADIINIREYRSLKLQQQQNQ